VGPRAGLNAVVKRKNSQPLQGLEPPIMQPVAHRYTTELSWLHKTPLQLVQFDAEIKFILLECQEIVYS
jgi:hypothetical protein